MKKTEIIQNFTELEKSVLLDMFYEGFATDNIEDDFMSWGVDGKQERGALASLVKKGVVCVEQDGRDKPVYLANGFTKVEIAEAVGYKF